MKQRKLLKQQLQKESKAVRMNSLRILKKLERLDPLDEIGSLAPSQGFLKGMKTGIIREKRDRM